MAIRPITYFKKQPDTWPPRLTTYLLETKGVSIIVNRPFGLSLDKLLYDRIIRRNDLLW
jgi:hypothetical protein